MNLQAGHLTLVNVIAAIVLPIVVLDFTFALSIRDLWRSDVPRPVHQRNEMYPNEEEDVQVQDVGKLLYTPDLCYSLLQADSDTSDSEDEGETKEISREKKRCGGQQTETLRQVMGPAFKRSMMAANREELKRRLLEDCWKIQKRTSAGGEPFTLDITTINSSQRLPWKCESQYIWKELGASYFPRFLKTVHCTSARCLNGFFYCRPKTTSVEILVLRTPADECYEENTLLPELLRRDWKTQNVTVNVSCECSLSANRN